MTDLKIELNDDRQAFEPGEELAGNASWGSDKRIDRLELRLFWFTRGKGIEDAGMAQTLRFEQPLPQETRAFQFQLPDAPYSFSGQLISLVWALELIGYPSKDVIRRESLPTTGIAQLWISKKC